MVTNQPSIQAQVNEMTQFATWLGGTLFLLMLGRAVSGAEKDMANYLLDIGFPEEIPLRIPQTAKGYRGGR